jgi:nicotinamide-nucleotide amidase
VSAAEVLAALRARGESLGTAESLTGGMLGSLITAVPGASDVYVGGVISYATGVKVDVLRVSPETVERYGVVSPECAEEMAEWVARGPLCADWAVSTTGVAGPDSQEGKPVGLVYVAVSGPAGTTVTEHHLEGDREQIRAAACEAALRAVLGAVGGKG